MGLRKTQQHTQVDEERRIAPRDFDLLAVQLASTDARERRWAARDLGEYPEASVTLVHALENESDWNVMEAIFTSLQKIANPKAIQGLLSLLASEEAFVRNSAIEVLQTMPQQVEGHIEALLLDPCSDIRIFALDILQQLAHANAPRWLHHVIANETHINVLATAVDRITELGDSDFIEALQALKNRFPEETFLHFAIDIALERLDSEGVV